MRGLRSFERRLQKIEARLAAEEAKAEEAKRGEVEGGDLEADLNRLCPVCLRIMQGRFEVDINERRRK